MISSQRESSERSRENGRDNGLQNTAESSSTAHDATERRSGSDVHAHVEKMTVEENGSDGAGNGSCCPRKFPPLRGLITLIACFFVQLSLGISYSFGNMVPYLTSYLRNRTSDTSLDYSTSLWINNTHFFTYAISLLFFGMLARRIPNRAFLCIGVVLFGAAFFGSRWAVQTSFGLTVFTYGCLYGMGQSVLYGGCVNLPLQWFPNRGGLVGGIVVAGFGGGAFVWNQVVTAWINPDNLQPDHRVGEDLYFTQAEVLDRVPSCFLVLGGILSGIQILCVISVSYPPADRRAKTAMDDITVSVTATDEPSQGTVSLASPSGSKHERSWVDKAGEHSTVSSSADAGEEEAVDYTTLMMVRTRTAWTIWWFYLCFEIAFTFIVNFYKTYGQTFIHDDHFLSLVGSFASFFNAAGRPVWGFLADKFGYQPCLMACQAIMACAAATLLTCEYVGGAMFLVWVCVIYLAIGGIYTTTPTVIFALFGARHYLSNLGFIITTGAVSALVTVFVASAAKDAFGWHGVFLVGAACLLFALLLNTSLLLDCGHPIPQHMKRQLFKKRVKGR